MNLSHDACSLAAAGCRVTLLTPAGRAAVATVSVEGSAAAALIRQHWRSRSVPDPASAPLGRVLVGHWQHGSELREEVVLCRRGECSFELNCHGGFAASEAILGSLVAAGATREEAPDWLARHVADPLQRSAWLSLGSARTSRTAAILLDQYRGALSAVIRGLREDLQSAGPLANVARQVARLLAWKDLGLHLTRPWQIVLAGPPNVGKSSLVNALVGYQRALVSDLPGTTRDVLVASTAVDGWPCELHDTAGLREAEHDIEADGIARARASIATADLVIGVIDLTATAVDLEAQLPATERLLRVANKTDAPTARVDVGAPWIRTSASTGAGLDLLLRSIAERLVPQSPEPGDAVPFHPDQLHELEQLQAAVRRQDTAAALACCDRLTPSTRR